MIEEEEEESVLDESPKTPHTAIQDIEEYDHIKPTKERLECERILSEIPGVHEVVLSDETQKKLGCNVGKHIVDNKPWVLIKKELFLIEEHDEFLPIQAEISQFAGDEILVGCILDDNMKDENQFYICIKQDSIEQVQKVFQKFYEDQQEQLRHYIYRDSNYWKSLGSEFEIDENQLKNNRPLIEVEIESKYPIFPYNIHLKARKALDCRDGYMELRPGDERPVNIFKRRIDNSAQIAPSTCENEAQTICKYPTNIATQYEYDIGDKLEISQETLETLKATLDDNSDEFNDLLQVNNSINLYTDDYHNLVKNRKYCDKLFKLNPEEYISFINKDLCENKTISCAAFHPMWTGTVATSYVDKPYNIYVKDNLHIDEVNRIVYCRNLVLLWSFVDDLMPKLILESPREVFSLSFCPWNPYLLIGGLDNGQIIVWDITDRLERVEAKEFSTIDQQHLQMEFMKNTESIATVHPTLLSNLEYSHQKCIHYIEWLSPKTYVTKTGEIEELSDGQSLQFITTSEDSCLLIWDLLMNVKAGSVESKSMKRTKRLKQRPSGLAAETSPFEYLHLNLRPIYKIKFTEPIIRLTAMCATFFQPIYRRRDEDFIIESVSDRVYYEFESVNNEYSKKNEIFVGSLLGDFIHATWNGQEFDSGEVVNYEDSSWINFGKYHDGPIVRIDYSAVLDAVLVIGGRIMSVWSLRIKNRPVVWRQSKSIYTDGSWFVADRSRIRLTRMDGHFEIWLFYQRSSAPIYEILLSNRPITVTESQRRKHINCVFGIAQQRGPFRIYFAGYATTNTVQQIQNQLKQYFEREITRKINFDKWQIEFNQKYGDFIETKVESERIQIIASETNVEKSKIKLTKDGIDTEKIKQQQREQDRIEKMILQRKQLDKEQLVKDREPLLKFEAELETRRKKQREILKRSDRIFRETIAKLFPDIIKEKPSTPKSPYEQKNNLTDLEKFYERFEDTSILAREFIEKNPFRYHFDWVKVLKSAKQIRKTLENFEHLHLERYSAIQVVDDKKTEYQATSTTVVHSDEAIVFDEEEAEETIDE